MPRPRLLFLPSCGVNLCDQCALVHLRVKLNSAMMLQILPEKMMMIHVYVNRTLNMNAQHTAKRVILASPPPHRCLTCVFMITPAQELKKKHSQQTKTFFPRCWVGRAQCVLLPGFLYIKIRMTIKFYCNNKNRQSFIKPSCVQLHCTFKRILFFYYIPRKQSLGGKQ